MRKTLYLLLTLVIALQAGAQKTMNHNRLSQKEKRDDWQLLFDGKTLNGWKGYNSDKIFECWFVKNGILVCQGSGGSETAGDLITNRQYENFELQLGWRISREGNSGVFYHVQEGEKYHAAYENGPEYQLIDDNGWPEKLETWQLTAADYAMHPASENKTLYATGKWNHTRIVYDRGHVEHWLNGHKVVEFEAYTPEWLKLRNESKWKDYPDYAKFTKGHIGLQNHGSGVEFRNIKIRELNH